MIRSRAGIGRVGVHVNKALDPVTGTIALSYTGNDIKKMIPKGMARPVFGGTYLGEFDKDTGVVETPNVQYKEKDEFGSTIPKDVRIEREGFTVSGKLLFKSDMDIRPILQPQTTYMGSKFFIGGNSTVPIRSLLVLIQEDIKRDVIECHFYHRGYFDPTPLVNGRIFAPMEMTYHVLSGKNNETGCLYPPGYRIGLGWWTSIEADGTNVILDPSGEPIVPAPLTMVSNYYPSYYGWL
jgi:hypothetical protein